MRDRRFSMLLFSILSCQGVFSAEQVQVNDNQPVLSTIWINGLDQYTEILLLSENDQKYVECQVIEGLNINVSLLKQHQKNSNLCLVSQSPIKAEFDSSAQAIKLQIPANYFLNSNDSDVLTSPEKASFGAFLNYDFFYTKDENNHDFNTLSELGIFKDNWIFRNSLIYRADNNSGDENKVDSIVRLSTTVDVEFLESYTRLTLGDTTNISNTLMNSFRFGGISWGTTYTERPDFIYWNIPALRGSAIVPSTVDLYINGVSIFQQSISPGDYNLQVGANIEKAGQAQIVVEDVLGNRTVQSFPVLISNRLLKPGLNEYNISLGKVRYNYDSKSDDYREFFTNLYFRRGISSQTTLGVNASYSEDLQNLGLMWTQGVSTYFVLDIVALASRTDEQDGYSAGVALSHNFGRFNFGLSSRYASPGYNVLGYEGDFTPSKLENLFYLGFGDVPVIQNLYLNYVEQIKHKNTPNTSEDSKVLTAGFNRQITQNLSLGAGYSREFGNSDDSSAFISLTYDFGKNRNVYMDYSTDGEVGLNYTKSSLEQVGLDYAVGVERRNSQTVYDLYGLAKTNIGNLSVQHTQSDQFHQTQLNYRGAMVWLDRHFGFTKSVDNAFALVRVGNYPDVDIYRSLSPIGKTNKQGYLFVHDIIPYINYDIAFDENQLPIDDKIPYSSKKISTLAQRGYIIEFPVYQAQSRVIRLLDTNQQPFPAGTEVHLNNPEKDLYPVGSDGLVQLYGLLPGQYKLMIFTTGGKSCQADLLVAEKILPEQQTQAIDVMCK